MGSSPSTQSGLSQSPKWHVSTFSFVESPIICCENFAVFISVCRIGLVGDVVMNIHLTVYFAFAASSQGSPIPLRGAPDRQRFGAWGGPHITSDQGPRGAPYRAYTGSLRETDASEIFVKHGFLCMSQNAPECTSKHLKLSMLPGGACPQPQQKGAECASCARPER